jgi:hydroxymethylglutaryl-CoA synthase
MKVGIDAVAFAAPRTFVDLSGEWSEQRAALFADGCADDLRKKVQKGIGMNRMRIPDAHEDIVTLAAEAVKKLLESSGITLAQVSHVLFATEGGVDLSKSASSYTLGLLAEYFSADVSHIANVELKFACVGSSYALEYATALIRSGMTSRRYVIIVSSDIAHYELCTPAEYTQGAGAVALAISVDPRLVVLDPHPMGVASADECDFFRPLFKDTPTVAGKHSVEVYLNLVEAAFQRYQHSFFQSQLKASPSDVIADSGSLLFHVPFPKMAEYMAARVLLPVRAGAAEVPKDPALRAEAEKAFRSSESFKAIFAEKIEPSLTLAREVGNIYSGALFLGLTSLLLQKEEHVAHLAGRRAIFFAYGSGASARAYSGTFVSGITPLSGAAVPSSFHSTNGALQAGSTPDRALSFAEYERLHAFHARCQKRQDNGSLMEIRPDQDSVCAPRNAFAYLGMESGHGEREGKRIYRYQN